MPKLESSSCSWPMPGSSATGRAHDDRFGSGKARCQTRRDRRGRERVAQAGRAVQSDRGLRGPVGRSPCRRPGTAVSRRSEGDSASRGRGEPGAAGSAPGRHGSGVFGRVLPGAAPWRNGGAVTATAIAREVGARLAKADSAGLNATLHWSAECLEAEATRVDVMNTPGALHALPIAVKDNIVTIEEPTTCGSRILEGYISPYTATAVRRLRAAGAMVACKANLDEFAMGSSTEHSAYGRVKNPLDHDRVPGGSSGGSAALVAADVVPAALGSETGGSVRQPASFCGVVGVKPTYGRVSRFGLVAFGSSLDCISVFGKSVDDATRVLSVMSGPDLLDATTVDRPPMKPAPAMSSLKGLKVGLPREYFPADLHPGVRAGLDRTVGVLRDLGAAVSEV